MSPGLGGGYSISFGTYSAESVARSSVDIVQRRQAFGLGDILDRISVEERIERLGRPIHRRERVARGPAVDLAEVLDDQRVTLRRRLAQQSAIQNVDGGALF